jgi:uncharacterized DUF497 family protein
MYIHLGRSVGYEWDEDKARTNRAKHSVDFADAVEVFYDRRAVTVRDEHPDEERFVTIGRDALARVIVVVYCWRVDRIRIISARRATWAERQGYEGYS